MATSKTLAPTNVTISIPAMADAPDASVFSNCVDKEADAINALNSKLGKTRVLTFSNTGTITIDLGYTPTTGHYGTAFLVCGNQSLSAIFNIGSTPTVTIITGNATLTPTVSGQTLTITSSNTLWGCTMVILAEYGS